MGAVRHWRKKRVLITGASGFIGQHLVHRLQGHEADVVAGMPPRSETNSPPAPSSLNPCRVAFDVRDAEAVQATVDKVEPDVVFHLAAAGVTDPAIDPMLALLVNAGGAVNVLEALRGSDVSRIVLVGTSHEYGSREAMERLDPFNAYAASKVAAWAYGRMYWRARGLPVITVRPFQVYGSGQADRALIPAVIRAAHSGDDFSTTAGEQIRDFVYVEDVVRGMMDAAEAPGIDGESLDIGTGVGHPVHHIVDRIWQLTGAEGEVRSGDLPYRPGEPMHLVANAERTAQLTGWRAVTTLDEGLSATITNQRRRDRVL